MRPPEAGYYKVRAHRTVPGQPVTWLPVRIYESVATDPVTGETLDRSPRLLALVNDKEADLWPLWEQCELSTKTEYLWLRAVTAIRQMPM